MEADAFLDAGQRFWLVLWKSDRWRWSEIADTCQDNDLILGGIVRFLRICSLLEVIDGEYVSGVGSNFGVGFEENRVEPCVVGLMFRRRFAGFFSVDVMRNVGVWIFANYGCCSSVWTLCEDCFLVVSLRGRFCHLLRLETLSVLWA